MSKLAALVERARARMRAGLDEPAGDGGGLTSQPFQAFAGFFHTGAETLEPRAAARDARDWP